MRVHTIHCAAIVLCIVSLASPAFAQLALPANLQVPPLYRPLVESIADRSPHSVNSWCALRPNPG